MRTKKTLKNITYAVASYLILCVITLCVRKCFLNNIEIELLGYEGLFGNIFTLLSIAEMGISSFIPYRMYTAFANDDKEEIHRLLSIYKFLYRLVGIIVLTIGIILLPLLPFIIPDNDYDWKYIYIIYSIQLAATLCTYFLAYKRIMLEMDQKEYVSVRVDTACTLMFNIIKIVALTIFKSYIFYLSSSLFNAILSNVIISRLVNKSYPYVNKSIKINIDDIKDMQLFDDIKNNLFQRIALIVYGGTDNIIISIFLGIGNVGFLSNYTLIQGYVTSFLAKVLSPFKVSIGEFVNKIDKNTTQFNETFRMFDLLSFFIASFVSVSYIILFNPFISLCFGEKYTYGMGFVIAFSINQFVAYNHQFLAYFRGTVGHYDEDRNYCFIGAILNIIFSLILSHYYGITGVIIGTVIGHIGFWIGRVRVVYRYIINEKISSYLLRQVFRVLLLSLEITISIIICSCFDISVLGIIERMIICAIIPTGINLIVFSKTIESKNMKVYFNNILGVIRRKK